MSERSELRSCREELIENGVKNLKGSKAIPQNLLDVPAVRYLYQENIISWCSE